MAQFPTSIQFEWRDFSEQVESVVMRSDMERGVPKQRRIKSDAMVTLSLTLNFKTKAAFADFRTWFNTDAQAGAGWFDFVHPRTGQTVEARFVSGQLGAIRHATQNLENVILSTQIEHLQSAWS